MPGKKKATGLSKRQSFLDRNVIAENNAIMRFNDELANAARGVNEPRTSGPARSRENTRERPPRSPRPARVPRPPAVAPELEVELRAAVAGSTEDTDVAPAGAGLVDGLVRGDRFERASEAGWRRLTEPSVPAERSSQDWERLRNAYAVVRRAVLAEWVKANPDAAPLQEKEEQAAVRAQRAASRRAAPRRPRRRTMAADRQGAPNAAAVSAAGLSEAEDRPEGEDPPSEPEAATGSPDGAASRPEGRPRRPRRRRPRRGPRPAAPVDPGLPVELQAPEPAPAGPQGADAVPEPAPPLAREAEPEPEPEPAAPAPSPPTNDRVGMWLADEQGAPPQGTPSVQDGTTATELPPAGPSADEGAADPPSAAMPDKPASLPDLQ